MAKDTNQRHRVSGFRTAKGSMYFVHSDDTTTRVKAKRPEHQDSGRKDKSLKTVYLTKNNAARLALPQGSWRIVDNFDGTLSLLTLQGNVWRAAESAHRVPYEITPKTGLIPLELWKPELYIQAHFGNAIIEVH